MATNELQPEDQSIDTKPVGAPTTSTPLANIFERVTEDRNSARKCLGLAMQSIRELETHVAELNAELNHIHAETQPALSIQQPALRNRRDLSQRYQLDINSAWIYDIWICKAANKNLLGVAEDRWMHGETYEALMELQEMCKLDLSFEDKVNCLLLRSAILCFCDYSEGSMECADEALEECEKHRAQNVTACRELSGVAHFLRGKIFMAEEEFENAYWAFCKALFAPGYQIKASELKSALLCKLVDNPEA